MAFEKGRQKTGGRVKGSPAKRATKFLDQLKQNGFDFTKEFAKALNALPEQTKYLELRFLLPYMAPKLREKQIEVMDPPETPATPVNPDGKEISTDDILKALEKDGRPETKSSGRDQNPVAARGTELQLPSGSEEDLSNLAGLEEENP